MRETQYRRLKRQAGWLRAFRSESDKGVGDTLERLIEASGGRRVQQALLSIGIECYCEDIKSWLNRHFPYRKFKGENK